uniref:SUEL-type lectin domain-containing protein n=1 Tax=Cyprinus carpio TaxID=7962 RepID=A0A8C2KWW9_CYPCA
MLILVNCLAVFTLTILLHFNRLDHKCLNAIFFLNLHVDGRLQINTANYGRTDKTTCSKGRPFEQLQNTNCSSPNALAPVSKSCNRMESWEVFATHTVFTDPCIGTYKYLAISYFCVPPAESDLIK